MLDGIVSLLTLAACVWILVSIGAKAPAKVQQFNKRSRKAVRKFFAGLIKDED